MSHQAVPLSEIDLWRAETVRVARHLRSRDSRLRIIRKFSDVLERSLEKYVKLKEGGTVTADLEELYNLAYNLAIALRESKTDFRWEQRHDPMKEEADDFKMFYNYLESDQHGRRLQYRMLFGPVYKCMDKSKVLIYKGSLLVPGKK